MSTGPESPQLPFAGSDTDAETDAGLRVIHVAVPRPLHAVYDYLVPAHLPLPAVGSRVEVPFGRSQTIGICVADKVDNPHGKLKAVAAVLDEQPILPGDLLDLAHWMTRYYHHPLGEVLATLLPNAARKGAPFKLRPSDCWRVCHTEFDNPRAKQQQALHTYLAEHPGSSGAAVVAAGFSRAVLRTMAKAGHIEMVDDPDAYVDLQPETPPQANREQTAAIDAVTASTKSYATFLLEGVTGSGKTEVYLQAIAKHVAAHRQVLVLVPEIALTPQTLSRFQRRFAGIARVAMLHSNLSDLERLESWIKASQGLVDIVVGTRSAVFTPFKSLGLIVVDEEHDSSYKQQEGLRYSARDIAAKRAHGLNIPLLLGSATPSLESLHNVTLGRYAPLSLANRATGAAMPTYHLIDMRGQQHTDGISDPLSHVIRRHLKAGNQVLVFLNRRGFAPTLLCASCGWQAQCPDCDARLTLHRSPPQLTCHHCTKRFPEPDACEACGKAALMPVGLGTQRSEAGLQKLFPEVPVLRIDRDTTRSARALETKLERINSGGSCLLVGTQMLAKGHHFPNVTLVAVLNADAGFLSPDFRAPERTAQLIVQVAGRAGREQKPGEVWIQTYQPESPALTQLIQQGYAGFARQELTLRTQAGMPPAHPMAMLRADAADPGKAHSFLEQCKQRLRNTGISVMGPVAAPLARLANRHRYQLMLLAPQRTHLHLALDRLDPPQVRGDLRWSIDIDPYDSL